MSEPVEGEEFFADDAQARAIYRALARQFVGLEGVEVRVSKSQVALRARRGFAFCWAPSRYISSDVPVVVSIALPERLESERFKEIAHPANSTWMHHVELRQVDDVDAELVGWVRRAWESAR